MLACGVCHTDLHIVEGDIHPPKLPITIGHQVVGIVDAIGHEVTGVQIGDRVGVSWLFDACGECEFCKRGERIYALTHISRDFMSMAVIVNICLQMHATCFLYLQRFLMNKQHHSCAPELLGIARCEKPIYSLGSG